MLSKNLMVLFAVVALCYGDDSFGSKFMKEVGSLGDSIAHHASEAKKGIQSGAESVGDHVIDAKDTVKDGVSDGYNSAKEGVKDGYNAAKDNVEDWKDTAGEAGSSFLDSFKSTANKAVKSVGESLGEAKDYIGEKLGVAKTKTVDGAKSVADAVKGTFDRVDDDSMSSMYQSKFKRSV